MISTVPRISTSIEISPTSTDSVFSISATQTKSLPVSTTSISSFNSITSEIVPVSAGSIFTVSETQRGSSLVSLISTISGISTSIEISVTSTDSAFSISATQTKSLPVFSISLSSDYSDTTEILPISAGSKISTDSAFYISTTPTKSLPVSTISISSINSAATEILPKSAGSLTSVSIQQTGSSLDSAISTMSGISTSIELSSLATDSAYSVSSTPTQSLSITLTSTHFISLASSENSPSSAIQTSLSSTQIVSSLKSTISSPFVISTLIESLSMSRGSTSSFNFITLESSSVSAISLLSLSTAIFESLSMSVHSDTSTSTKKSVDSSISTVSKNLTPSESSLIYAISSTQTNSVSHSTIFTYFESSGSTSSLGSIQVESSSQPFSSISRTFESSYEFITLKSSLSSSTTATSSRFLISTLEGGSSVSADSVSLLSFTSTEKRSLSTSSTSFESSYLFESSTIFMTFTPSVILKSAESLERSQISTLAYSSKPSIPTSSASSIRPTSTELSLLTTILTSHFSSSIKAGLTDSFSLTSTESVSQSIISESSSPIESFSVSPTSQKTDSLSFVSSTPTEKLSGSSISTSSDVFESLSGLFVFTSSVSSTSITGFSQSTVFSTSFNLTPSIFTGSALSISSTSTGKLSLSTISANFAVSEISAISSGLTSSLGFSQIGSSLQSFISLSSSPNESSPVSTDLTSSINSIPTEKLSFPTILTSFVISTQESSLTFSSSASFVNPTLTENSPPSSNLFSSIMLVTSESSTELADQISSVSSIPTEFLSLSTTLAFSETSNPTESLPISAGSLASSESSSLSTVLTSSISTAVIASSPQSTISSIFISSKQTKASLIFTGSTASFMSTSTESLLLFTISTFSVPSAISESISQSVTLTSSISIQSTDSSLQPTVSTPSISPTPTETTSQFTSSTTSLSTESSTTSTTPTTPLRSGLLCTFGSADGDLDFHGEDDGCSPSLQVRYGLPIKGQRFTTIYICTNGLICFNKPYNGFFVPRNNEFNNDFEGVFCLCPHFTDIDLTELGKIWYHAYDYLIDTEPEDGEVSIKVKESVKDIYGEEINPTFILKVTWEDAPLFGRMKNERLTFQVLYVTDGLRSYTLYYYGNMNGEEYQPFIGIIADGFAEGLDDSADGSYLRRANINLVLKGYQGASSFKLTTEEEAQVPNYAVQCLSWRNTEKQKIKRYNVAFNRMPTCPCVARLLRFDRRFRVTTFTNEVLTASVLPGRAYFPHGKTCAYNVRNGGFIFRGRNTGSFESINYFLNSDFHSAFDLQQKKTCCELSNNCAIYYQVRPPIRNCYFRVPFRFGRLFGDPHVSTLDGKGYTFNGHGEYVLLRAPTANFEIQSRTERARKSDGRMSEATIFSAFALQASDAWLQVELNTERSGINLFVGTNKTDWVDYTTDFSSKGDNFTFVSDSLSLSRDNMTIVSSFSETGVTFNITVGVGILQMSIGLIDFYENTTSGLLGNFNGDASDDFIPRNRSSALPSNSSERDVFHKFGQTWITSEDESIFKYDNGKSHTDYNYPHFVPKFLDEANLTIVNEAEGLCGKGNNQCIFDFVFTGNAELAQLTNSTEAEVVTTKAEISNEVPELSVISETTTQGEENYLFVTVNELATFTILGKDDGSITYHFVNNSIDASFGTKKADGSVDVSFILTETTPAYLSIIVTDDKGVNSPPLDIVIVLCSKCNLHGECNNSLIRDDEMSTDYFKYATCNCEPYWTGADCENDLNGCEASPCSLGRNCTDRDAEEHKASPSLKPYTCTPCPAGYNDINDKCEDINECNDTTKCSQECVNAVGSYYCKCKTGYRLTNDGTSCTDINECEEATSGCSQVCTNAAGSFVCSCFDGFTYNSVTKTCDKNQIEPDGCDAIDCSKADGCTINESSVPVCFCNNGYNIQADNTCKDIDECKAAVCTQSCSNTEGSYKCSCFTGYSLQDDKVSCNPCPFPTYGTNCGLTCQCGRGSLRCDSVRGCICKDGWEGTSCDTNINECLVPNVCADVNKVCTNTIGSYICTCRAGYILINGVCNDVDECNEPILNTCEQVCTNTEGGFSCSCNPGYNIDTTDFKKCTDYDECTAGVSGCEHICTNKPGRYNCECYFGFLLNPDRKTCTKVSDPCTLFPDVKCSDICIIVNEKPKCTCNTGYVLGTDEQTCIDVNECDPNLSLNQCSQQESCVNEAGGYRCSCKAGFKLENDLRTCIECDSFHYGENCANDCKCGVGSMRCDPVTGCVCNDGWTGSKCDLDRDECANFPCTGQHEICTNTPGSYTCTCDSGYKEKNGACHDIDECLSINLNECSQVCTNTPGSYQCSCYLGFIKDGNICTDIDECEGQNDCSQVCNNTLGSYRCSCNEGFKLETTLRRTCIPAEQCDPDPCNDGSQCAVVSGKPKCTCDSGYRFEAGSNTTCEDILECSASPPPCSQRCEELPGGYQCSCDIPGYWLDTDKSTCVVCPEGTYGDNCTQNCTCSVGNTVNCNATNGLCMCKKGLEGDTCADNVKECEKKDLHQCPENSECIDTEGSFYCKCRTGFIKSGDGACQGCDQGKYGVDCNDTCACETSNTVSCDAVNGSCNCKEGWEGDDCSINKDECTLKTFTCPLNSECADIDGSYNCNCELGYSKSVDGDKCEVCDSKYYGQDCATPCSCYAVNTDLCDHVNGTCTCKNGWEGSQCSVDIDECKTGNFSCAGAHRSVCKNTQGSYICLCDEGYELDDADMCVDINECDKETDDCLQNCTNTDGSYTCFCDVGYSGTGNNCTASTPLPPTSTLPESDQSVSVRLTLEITVNENLTVKATYEKYFDEVLASLTKIYAARLGNVAFRIEIKRISVGSLVVDYNIIVPKTSLTDVATVNVDLSSGNTPVEIFTENAFATGVVINNKTVSVGNVTTDEQICEIYEITAGKCGTDYLCKVTDGKPSCQLRQSQDTLTLILGLGLGIPLFFLAVALLILIIVYYHQFYRRNRRGNIREDDEYSDNSFYRGGIPVRMITGIKQGPYSDWSEDTSFHDNSGYRREPINPYMFYDNVGKTGLESDRIS